MSKTYLLLLWLFSTLTACSVPSQPDRPTATASTAIAASTSTSPTVAPATSTLVLSLSFTSTPVPTRTATRRPKITSTPRPLFTRTPESSSTPTQTPYSIVAAPPGLIYSASKAQWQITADGKPTLIITGTDVLVSPNRQMAIVHPECCGCGCDRKNQLANLIDGNARLFDSDLWYGKWSRDSQHFYYIAPDKNGLEDVWVEDVTTGERHNLSKTPNRHEGQLFIWPNQPDYLFFYSWPLDVVADGEDWHGYPTIMKTDGTEYQVISSDLGTGLIALSPDGRTIAYSDWERAWYYRRGEKAQLFPWQDFGLIGLKDVQFYSPSWSSDGLKIAWSMSGKDRTGYVNGVRIFDLQAGTARFLRDWIYIKWSPNRRWIIGERTISKPESRGIWVADVNVEKAHLLAEVLNSINGTCHWEWSPDEQWLALNCFSAADTALNSGVWLAELETGKLLKTNLPDDAQIRGWVNP